MDMIWSSRIRCSILDECTLKRKLPIGTGPAITDRHWEHMGISWVIGVPPNHPLSWDFPVQTVINHEFGGIPFQPPHLVALVFQQRRCRKEPVLGLDDRHLVMKSRITWCEVVVLKGLVHNFNLDSVIYISLYQSLRNILHFLCEVKSHSLVQISLPRRRRSFSPRPASCSPHFSTSNLNAQKIRSSKISILSGIQHNPTSRILGPTQQLKVQSLRSHLSCHPPHQRVTASDGWSSIENHQVWSW